MNGWEARQINSALAALQGRPTLGDVIRARHYLTLVQTNQERMLEAEYEER